MESVPDPCQTTPESSAEKKSDENERKMCDLRTMDCDSNFKFLLFLMLGKILNLII